MRYLNLALLSSLLFFGCGGAVSADEPATQGAKSLEHWTAAQALLKKRCVSCHGVEKQEGGLRLDRGQKIVQGGDSGKVIVPGTPADSPLLERVTSKDDDVRMPPEGAPLSTTEVAVLRAWIEAGAKWSDDGSRETSSHWALQPVSRPAVPMELSDPGWVKNGIDAFVLRKLDESSIKPSPQASKAELIRRVYLDLLGIPPTPKQLDAFLNDKAPESYSTMVTEALQSPHYGERWARHWLDLARYADSDGYEKDRPRPNAWRYRQWVIEALNQNMPFDAFTVHQIAGDMLQDAAVSQRVATGFHRNTLHNTEGGTDKEEDRVKKTVDRINTVGSVWMGLTVGCAQCHTHKYDPISQREYYQLYGFFNDIDEKDVPAPTPEEEKQHAQRLSKHTDEAKQLEKQRDQYVREQFPDAQAKWEASAVGTAAAWSQVSVLEATSKHSAKLETSKDGVIFVSGVNRVSDVYTVRFTAPIATAAIRLEVMPDKRLPKNGPGRADNGNFVLTDLRLATPSVGDGEQGPIAVGLSSARADFSQKEWSVDKAINDNREDGWAVSPEIGKAHRAAFVLETPVDAGTEMTLALDQNYNGNTHNLGKFRITVCPVAEAPLDGMPKAVVDALNVAIKDRTSAQAKVVSDYFRGLDPALAKLNKQIADHASKRPKGSSAVAQAVMERSAPRTTKIHLRGDFLNPGETVTRQGLEVLPPISARNGGLPDRLDLAYWLVSEENPLTARVTVNRIWQRYFGRGIVASVDDFGSQGALPTHPELLDWLANQLRDHDWDLKHIHRLIVTSATYRQSSSSRSELAAIDPDNELLARHSRQRVEAEIVRDLALAVSGLLDPRIGGPSVRPPQPDEYSKLTYANSAKWVVSKNGDQYRRGLYTFFQRTSPYPMLMTFDSPDSTACTARRSESNTPLQALTIWNDTVFFECSQHLGRRIVAESPAKDLNSRAEFASKLCLSKPLSESLEKQLAEIHRQHLALCQAASDEQRKALLGPAPLPGGSDAADVAAWVLTGRVLLNLDAFIVKP